MKKIAIIGTGYVGLVSGAGLAEFGNDVICADNNKNKIDQLKSGKIPIYEPGLKSLVEKNVKKNRIAFSTDVERAIYESEIIFIAVGTPSDDSGAADLSAVEAVSKIISHNLNNYKIVCTKSTVPVGTGDWITKIIKKESSGKEFDYVSNPEFLREGAAVNDFLYPDRVVVGTSSKKAFKVMREVYRPLYLNETPIVETGVETAEMIKYASNSFLALKISYINEIANLCEAVGADVHQVAKAMGKDGRISSKFLHPGPGFGGSCFPKDIQALHSLGKEKNVILNTVEATIKTNAHQKNIALEKILKLVDNDISDSKVAILGLSFKPNTDDIRESPSSYVISELVDRGAKINAYDPVAHQNFKSDFPNINYFTDWRSCVTGADICAVMTEWNEFRGIDLSELKTLLNHPAIFDAKNIYSVEKLKQLEFKFENIGRNF